MVIVDLDADDAQKLCGFAFLKSLFSKLLSRLHSAR